MNVSLVHAQLGKSSTSSAGISASGDVESGFVIVSHLLPAQHPPLL